MPTITVIGSSNTDLVVRVPRIPAPGETVLGGDLRRFAGGKGANQAVAARRLGAEVVFIGCLGDDDFGNVAYATLAAEGLRLDHVRRVAGTASGVALIAVASGGENSIVVAPGANMLLTRADVDAARDAFAQSTIVVAQLETPLDATQHAFTLARAAGGRTLLNPAPAQPLPADLLALTEALVCNATEAAFLAGVPVAEQTSAALAAHALRQRGPNLVIITLGAQGCLVLAEDEPQFIPVRPVTVVDATAAGDAFIGALAVRLALGETAVLAAHYATAAAALCVGRAGVQPALPTATEVAALLAGGDAAHGPT